MAEEKKAYDEYTIECGDDVQLDQAIVTSLDVSKKQFSTSYTTTKFNATPGSLGVKEGGFELDKDDKLVSITLDVVAPAKGEKDMDDENEYKFKV